MFFLKQESLFSQNALESEFFQDKNKAKQRMFSKTIIIKIDSFFISDKAPYKN